MAEVLKAGNVQLPSPVSISTNDELIWTADTGRLMDGMMVGEVVAEKKTISLKWQFITETEMLKIKNNMTGGFFTFTFHDDGIDMTIDVYRGTLAKERLPDVGDGIVRYRSVSVDVIQR